MSEKTIFDRLEDYIKANYVGEAIDFVCDEVTDHTQDDPDDPFTAISESVSCRPVVDSDQIPLDEVTESFQETFLNFLGIKADSELYDKILSSQLISKIRIMRLFQQKSCDLLGIGLELNREEMEALLRSARYRLSRSHKDELAIAFCIENKIYDVKQIDQLFDDQGLLPISQRI